MPDCAAPHEDADLNGIYCQLPEGHDGEHEALVPITWQERCPECHMPLSMHHDPGCSQPCGQCQRKESPGGS